MSETNLDVVIIGAGISGINAAYRLQTKCPDKSYAILENRFDIGGTWDLFQYPGIRSDSDLYTFGFAWRPWTGSAIASGQLIKDYVKESASLYGIDRKISFGHRVTAADWSTETQSWRLTVQDHDDEWRNVQSKVYNAKFVIFGTGYYNYEEPLDAVISGIENFKGTKVHPQFWPEHLDYADKKVAIVGSGATAITLLPSLCERAERVTIVQRSPSYVVSAPKNDSLKAFLHRWLPAWLAYSLLRLRFAALALLLYTLCRAYPERAKRALKKRTAAALPPNIPYSPHFEPAYNPWEQRMCVSPDGDFFKALHSGKGDMATGVIKTMTEDRIVLESGQEVEADIIVTATGLKLRMLGGTAVVVDGKPFVMRENFLWRGVMVENLPNAAVILGYSNASWTLGADAAALHICRILNSMTALRQSSVVPAVDVPGSVKPGAARGLKSTYLIRGRDVFPKGGDRAPWLSRRNFFVDSWQSRTSSLIDGLKYQSVSS